MMTLGIDPDTKNTGLAMVSEIHGIPYVSRVATAQVKASLPIEKRLPLMAEAIHVAVRDMLMPYENHMDIVLPRMCAIEWQSIRPKEKTRPNDMMNLVGVSGMCAAAVAGYVRDGWSGKDEFEMWLPLPSQWKPSIPKRIHQARLRKYLAFDTELRSEDMLCNDWSAIPGSEEMTKTQRGHVMDAIGLAWEAMKKVAPVRKRG